MKNTSMMERLFLEAGLRDGMRVADVGCASGEISLLASRLVGQEGQVVGFDHDAQSLSVAEQRAHAEGHTNMTFVQCDLIRDSLGAGIFDAIVGRRILTYLPDPTAAMKRLVKNLRHGGIVVFQESDSTMTPGRISHLPLHDKVTRWITKTVEREGANAHMGFSLPNTLQDAGLVVKHICAEAVIQGQEGHYPLTFIVRAMLPRIVGSGVASESEIDIETLEQRLATERPANVVYISDMAFGVWALKP